MGLLVKGEWVDQWYDTEETDGEFVREESQFRNWIGDESYPAEAGRYHLFVSLACPWAHRALIFRKLKSLEAAIDVTVVKPEMLENGWELDDAANKDLGYAHSPVEDLNYLHELYTIADSKFSGRVTVPLLWDKTKNTIVNNESADIIRMMNHEFDSCINEQAQERDYYPSKLRDSIDAINDDVYNNINNGVYKTGFATKQTAYEKAFTDLFAALKRVEDILSQQRYLVGDEITEADWRLFTTLIRFDSVYYVHFKANESMIEQFEHLPNYLRELYQQPGIAETVNFDHIKTHYYYSHDNINPHRLIPVGPLLDYTSEHNRDQLFS